MENLEYGFCSLITATHRVLEKIRTENKIYAKITYPNRIEKEMYDYVAVREAVINAIVHNDWSNEYPPKFELFNNKIEISSFGGIQSEFTEEEFLLGYSIRVGSKKNGEWKAINTGEKKIKNIRKAVDFYI